MLFPRTSFPSQYSTCKSLEIDAVAGFEIVHVTPSPRIAALLTRSQLFAWDSSCGRPRDCARGLSPKIAFEPEDSRVVDSELCRLTLSDVLRRLLATFASFQLRNLRWKRSRQFTVLDGSIYNR
ncbi:hypothetical protein KC322_g126 [Hortaea werneckii]|nr:hypothetical protein KC322_g126 [Hortaea werneckii]